MQPIQHSTRYADLTSREALLVAGVTVTALVGCLTVALIGQAPAGAPERGGSDLELYRSIIERVHAGENYYEAAGSELRAQGYPSGSLFNWRPPVYAWLIGTLPTPAWGQVIVSLFAVITLFLAYSVVKRDGKAWQAVAVVLLLIRALQWCVDGDAFLSQELWAGILIALSICAYAWSRWPTGVATGLLALFLRELALPYCLLALAFAWRQGRRGEVLVWLIGLSLYALFLAHHGMEVARHITPADRQPGSWIQLGGLSFLLKTCRMNAFLIRCPTWVSAIYLPLALLGLAGWRGTTAQLVTLTVVAYLVAFAVVGQHFNDYWGLLYAPLLPFGLIWAPVALSDLSRAILSAHHVQPVQAPGQA